MGGRFYLGLLTLLSTGRKKKKEHETIVVNNFSAYDDIKKTRCEKLYFLIKRIKVPILLTLYPMQKAK